MQSCNIYKNERAYIHSGSSDVSNTIMINLACSIRLWKYLYSRCNHTCIYVCVHVYMFVSMYACMYIRISGIAAEIEMQQRELARYQKKRISCKTFLIQKIPFFAFQTKVFTAFTVNTPLRHVDVSYELGFGLFCIFVVAQLCGLFFIH